MILFVFWGKHFCFSLSNDFFCNYFHFVDSRGKTFITIRFIFFVTKCTIVYYQLLILVITNSSSLFAYQQFITLYVSAHQCRAYVQQRAVCKHYFVLRLWLHTQICVDSWRSGWWQQGKCKAHFIILLYSKTLVIPD